LFDLIVVVVVVVVGGGGAMVMVLRGGGGGGGGKRASGFMLHVEVVMEGATTNSKTIGASIACKQPSATTTTPSGCHIMMIVSTRKVM